jgi:hypothetical protein
MKKALDHFINQRMSSTLDRKRLQFDTNEEDIVPTTPKKKAHGSSFKGTSSVYSKNDKINRA